ncbi:hypothetical protein NDU88_002364 [Pleurodeles waltl]|uniref:Uncharacterized protein n=1 Tax=Pleurodeles waltl TaxID=8319 RepID=A0AAV7U920_PLEWA|nr:hypothetical protein NDU88_002364 [Pleurodeles waltl]
MPEARSVLKDQRTRQHMVHLGMAIITQGKKASTIVGTSTSAKTGVTSDTTTPTTSATDDGSDALFISIATDYKGNSTPKARRLDPDAAEHFFMPSDGTEWSEDDSQHESNDLGEGDGNVSSGSDGARKC